MTVWDNVAFGPRSRKVPKAEIGRRVEEMLPVVRLDDFAGRKPSQLSGGQQQRVALARALVNYPSALLLDEPLGALDLKLRQIMQFELKRIQRDVGITFVYVTHDQEEALTMSDRIAVMNAGRVEQIGTPIDIYARPASVFVAGFIGQANLWPCRVVGAAAPTGDGASAFDVDVLGTTLPSACGGVRIEVGGSATLMVRPERVRVTTDEPTGPGTVAATVTDLTFQGPLVRLSLAAADGSPIVAQLGHEVDLPLLRPGDRVWASWPADASLVLRAGADVHPGARNAGTGVGMAAPTIEARPSDDLAVAAPSQRRRRRRPGRLGDLALRVVAGLVLVYLFIPIAVIVAFSFNDPAGRFNLTWQGFTLAWADPFRFPQLTEALETSLQVAALSTAVSVVLGTLVAVALVRQRFAGGKLVETFLVLPLTSPEVVMGASLLTLFLDLGWNRGFGTNRDRPHRLRGQLRGADGAGARARPRLDARGRGDGPRGAAAAHLPAGHAAPDRARHRGRRHVVVRAVARRLHHHLLQQRLDRHVPALRQRRHQGLAAPTDQRAGHRDPARQPAADRRDHPLAAPTPGDVTT